MTRPFAFPATLTLDFVDAISRYAHYTDPDGIEYTLAPEDLMQDDEVNA